MEILNGTVKKVVGRSKVKALDMGSNNSHYCNRWILRGLIISCLLSMTGCSGLKSSLMTGAATSAIVGVTSVLPGGVLVPSIAGGLTAATASALTAEKPGKAANITADTVVNKAPDNFWTLLGKLISMGGWALILIVVVPMLFSWLMPGPIQFKGKKKNGS
jgi:hypothetical protein